MTPEELRASILQQAIQGKLVEQRSEEGTGKELFQQIQAEKQALIKDGKIKKEKPMSEITDEEKPYDIPTNWTWVRFGDLGSYKKGPFGSAITKSMFIPKGNGAIKVYEQKNAIQKDATLGDYYISRNYFESKMKGFELFPGDIIVSCAGTIGETYVMPEEFEQGIINQALMRMKIFEPLYIPYFLTFFDFVLKKDARSSSKGSAIKNIPPFEVLKSYLVPLPPLEEQKRIVAKLEEIRPLLDRYETAWNKLEEFNKRFPGDMQKSILQLAIQGKLVEQCPEEGTGEELFQQIQTEKQTLIKAGKIKKEKPLPEITEDEIPFDIPSSWKWVRLIDLCKSISDGDHQPPPQVPRGIPFLVISNVSGGSIDFSNTRYVPQDYFYALSGDRVAEKGDILFTVTGSYGIPIKVDCEQQFCFQRHIALLKLLVDWDYLYFALMSPAIKAQCDAVATGTAQKTVGLKSLRSMLVPLPPLAEQKRIVAKLEEILPLCVRLK